MSAARMPVAADIAAARRVGYYVASQGQDKHWWAHSDDPGQLHPPCVRGLPTQQDAEVAMARAYLLVLAAMSAATLPDVGTLCTFADRLGGADVSVAYEVGESRMDAPYIAGCFVKPGGAWIDATDIAAAVLDRWHRVLNVLLQRRRAAALIGGQPA